MSILGWVRKLRDGKQVVRHVDRIVARYLGLVREAVVAKVAGMPRAEARGYVRVKALTVVAPAVERVDGRGEAIPARLYDAVTTLAVERLVVEIMRQLGAAHISAPKKRRAA